MRVVWIAHDGHLGGAGLALLEGAKGLLKKEVQLHTIVPFRGKLAEALEDMGIAVTILPYFWWATSRMSILGQLRYMVRNVIASGRLGRILRRIRPDVVVSNTLTIPVGAVASKLAGIPHIWCIHEFGQEDHGLTFHFGRPLTLYLVRKLSARVIVNSQAVYEKFRQSISSAKLRVVYQAVETPEEHNGVGENGGALQLVLLGRKAPGKGQEDAVRAMAVVWKKGLNVRLRIVGAEEAQYGLFLRKLAGELRVEERIDFAPFTDRPMREIASCHVALMCSRNEAFGRVTVEGMKLGKPVVGANRGGTVELIRDGWNGLLYRAGDADDLARKIELLYGNRVLVRQMGVNARTWSRGMFTLENYASSLMKVFEEVLRSGGRSGNRALGGRAA